MTTREHEVIDAARDYVAKSVTHTGAPRAQRAALDRLAAALIALDDAADSTRAASAALQALRELDDLLDARGLSATLGLRTSIADTAQALVEAINERLSVGVEPDDYESVADVNVEAHVRELETAAAHALRPATLVAAINGRLAVGAEPDETDDLCDCERYGD